MVNLMLKLKSIMTWINTHKRFTVELILSSLLALSMMYGITMHKNNQMLSESLKTANNNIEAYQDIVNESQQACGVLKLDMQNLQQSNDKLIQQIDSVRKVNKIKDLNSAATQTQSLVVSKGKGVRGQDILTILKDTTYNDSIHYNDLTIVYYNIGKDSVNITLDIKNTQYLYTYKQRVYKNKKNFLKRLFTLDFKKVDLYKYTIINSNDLLKESDIRIIEQQ